MTYHWSGCDLVLSFLAGLLIYNVQKSSVKTTSRNCFCIQTNLWSCHEMMICFHHHHHIYCFAAGYSQDFTSAARVQWIKTGLFLIEHNLATTFQF